MCQSAGFHEARERVGFLRLSEAQDPLGLRDLKEEVAPAQAGPFFDPNRTERRLEKHVRHPDWDEPVDDHTHQKYERIQCEPLRAIRREGDDSVRSDEKQAAMPEAHAAAGPPPAAGLYFVPSDRSLVGP